VYYISTRLPVNNHRSYFFYSNIFVFRNMTSFGNKRRCLTTTASKLLGHISICGILLGLFWKVGVRC